MKESACLVKDTQDAETSSETEEEREYAVEKFLDKRSINGKVEYLIKWYGYPEKINSWEPKENLRCEIELKEFEEKLKQASEKKYQQKKVIEHSRRSTRISLRNSTIASASNASAGPSNKYRRKTTPSNTSVGHKAVEKIDKVDKVKKVNDKKEDNDVNTTLNISVDSVQSDNDVVKKLERIIGCSNVYGNLMFMIKWIGIEEVVLIPAKYANIKWEQEVIQFYEERIHWFNKD